MGRNNLSVISIDELRSRLGEKDIILTDEELLTVVEVIKDWNQEKYEDGLFTLISVRWKTRKKRYVKISIPW